jgi:hypothetical protein
MDQFLSALLLTITGVAIGILASHPMSKRVTVPTMIGGFLTLAIGLMVWVVTHAIVIGAVLLFLGTTVFSIGFVGAWHQARKEVAS